MIRFSKSMLACIAAAQLLTLRPAGARPMVEVAGWNDPTTLPPAQIPIRSYGSDRGLINSSAGIVRQDAEGFIWVGTEDGLFRYDGRRFVGFGIAAGLPSSHITAITPGRKGELWIGTMRGVAKRAGDGFIAVGGERGLPAEQVAGIAIDSNDRVWVALPQGLFKSPDGGGFETAPGWDNGPATAVLALGATVGEVWAAAGRMVGCWSQKTGWAFWPVDTQGEPIDGLVIDNQNLLWVRTRGHLFAKKLQDNAFVDYSSYIPSPNSRGYLSRDRAGNVLVPTNAGLLTFKDNTWRSFGMTEGLPTSWARDAFEDREGSLWIASVGVCRLLGRGLWRSWSRDRGLPSDVVWGIYRDRQRRLWVATDGGLCLGEPQGWRTLRGTEGYGVRSVTQARDNSLWMGGWERELLRYDFNSQTSTKYGDTQGFTGGQTLSLFTDSSGATWIGTAEAGLWRLITGANPRFVREALPNGSGKERVGRIAEDADGRLWVATSNGLFCLEKGLWKRFSSADGLRRDHVNFVLPSAYGDLWLVYFEALGVERVRVVNGRIEALQNLSVSTGLPSNKVYFIGLDQQNWLWIGLSAGVSVVTPKGLRIHSVSDGLVADDCDTNAFLADPDGGVFVGTSSGLSYYTGGDSDATQAPPTAHIVKARIGKELLRPGGPTRQVGWRERTFEARFVGLSFVNEDQIELQARLVGFDPNWVVVHSGEVTYAALPPATYRFETRARAGDGGFGPVANVSFEIGKPWWQSWLAQGSLLVLLAGVLLVIVIIRRVLFRRRIDVLEQQVWQRTTELSAARRTLNDLSVIDSLTGLKNRRFVDLAIGRDVALVKRAYRELRLGRTDRLIANTDLAFYYLDIDGLGEVNATLGETVGDAILQGMRAILSSNSRESDAVVRWDADEFVAIARNSARAEVTQLAERLRSAVEKHTFTSGDGSATRCTCSIGFVVFPLDSSRPDDYTWEDTVALAKTCAGMANLLGGNCWVGVTVVRGPFDANPAHWTPAVIEQLVKDNRIDVETSLGKLDWQR